MKFLIFIVSFAAIISAIFCSRGQRSKDGKIIGGMAIRIEEAPYQASLRFFDYHVCGAAIISKTYLITAAHCEKHYFIFSDFKKHFQALSERRQINCRFLLVRV